METLETTWRGLPAGFPGGFELLRPPPRELGRERGAGEGWGRGGSAEPAHGGAMRRGGAQRRLLGCAAVWGLAGLAAGAGGGAGVAERAAGLAAAGGGGRLTSAQEWVARHAGVVLEGVQLGDVGPGGGEGDLGVFAGPEGLPEGEPYLSVPWDLVLGPHSPPEGSDLARCFADMEARFGQDSKTQLLLLLLHERFTAGARSRWAEYIAALPESFYTPLYWGPRVLRELQGSHALPLAIEEQARVRALHKGLSRRVFANWPELFPPETITLEAVSWAWSVVHSRASHVPGKGRLLVPLADFVRDSGGPVGTAAAADGVSPVSAAVAATTPTGFVEYDPVAGSAVVYSKRAYRRGEEILEDYGDWTMADLMQQAGYLPKSRAGDCVSLRVDEGLAPAHVDQQRLRALLAARGFKQPWYACLRPGARDSLRQFVQFGALLEAEEAGRYAEDATTEADGGAGPGQDRAGSRLGSDAGETRPPEPERHWELVMGVLEMVQAQYNATSIDEDEALLASYLVLPGGDGGESELVRVRLATEFRLREKLVLRRLVDSLRAASSLAEWVDAAL